MKLLDSYKIRNLLLKNRIVMPAMVTNFANIDGTVSDRTINYYKRRAEGGVGTIIIEATAVDELGRGFTNMLGIWSDRHIDGLKKLVEIIKTYNTKVVLQLFHAGRQTRSKIIGTQPVAPSSIPWRPVGEIPRELTIAEIKELINKYTNSAIRAKKAGFDAVELHGAHSYLICQFLSPQSNKRQDEYGGSLNKRAKFAIECIKSVKEKVDLPIFFRISADEFTSDGLKLDQTRIIAKLLEENGISALNVSAGCYEAPWWIIQPMMTERGCLVKFSEEIKKEINIPVLVAGRINDYRLAEEIIQNEKADLICMGRALICDPDLPNKLKKEEYDDIRLCIACNNCADRLDKYGLMCMQNPEVGKEYRYKIEKTKNVKIGENIVVVGGSSTGIEVALHFAEKGKKVTIIEMLKKWGEDLGNAVKNGLYIPNFKKYNVQIITEAKLESIEENGIIVDINNEKKFISADTVILATGATPNQILYSELKDKFENIYLIGDCNQVGKIIDAIHQAYEIGMKVLSEIK